MAVRTFVLESMVYRTAGQLTDALAGLDLAKDVGKEAGDAIGEYAVEASINKVFGSEVLDFVADEAVQIHGGYGYMQEYVVERAYRDARINRIFEGTNEINRLLIPGTMLRRAMKGELPLLGSHVRPAKGADRVRAIVRRRHAALRTTRWRPSASIVDNLRKLTLMVAGLAAQKHMEKIEQEQELLAAAADLGILLYAAESAPAAHGKSRLSASCSFDMTRAVHPRSGGPSRARRPAGLGRAGGRRQLAGAAVHRATPHPPRRHRHHRPRARHGRQGSGSRRLSGLAVRREIPRNGRFAARPRPVYDTGAAPQ